MASVTELIGMTFDGRYQIVDLIGKGGMGAVYKANHLAMNQMVALKVLSQEALSDDTAVQRFYHEAKASSRLKHPNTIKVFDFGRSEEGHLYLVMEYLEGQTLGSLLREEKVLSVGRTIKIVKQVLKSLGEAHDQGLVHRDLKPDNIFLTKVFGEDDFVKVLDFGISKFVDTSPEHESLTQAGLIPGTPLYVSPEQALGRSVDGRSDLYSLGIIMYQMVSGKPPFKADSAVALVMKQIHDLPPDPNSFNPNLVLPDRLKRLIFQLLEKDPNKRPEKALNVYQELTEIEREGGYPDVPSKDIVTVETAASTGNIVDSTKITRQKSLTQDEHESPTTYIQETDESTANAKTQFIEETDEPDQPMPERPTAFITTPFTDTHDGKTLVDDTLFKEYAKQRKRKKIIFSIAASLAVILGIVLFWALSGPKIDTQTTQKITKKAPPHKKVTIKQKPRRKKITIKQTQPPVKTPKTAFPATKPTQLATAKSLTKPNAKPEGPKSPVQKQQKIEKPQKAEKPKTYPIAISTQPPKAKIAINGEDKGQAPLTYTVPPKTKKVVITASLPGYTTQTRTITITKATPASTQKLVFVLKKLKPKPKTEKRVITHKKHPKLQTKKITKKRKRPKKKRPRKKKVINWDDE